MQNHPASFHNWVERRSDKLRHDGRPEWAKLTPVTDMPRIAVLIHVFYAELLDDILSHLSHIPASFDVVITNATGETLAVREELAGENARNFRVLTVPNHGRDIYPMISVINAGLLEPYDLVFKVHTKRSEWRAEHENLTGTGEEWRQQFLSELAGSTETVTRILSAFAENPALGIVTAADCIVGREHWGGDEYLTSQLLKRIELEHESELLQFASGSIYWVRGFILNGLYSLDLTDTDFDAEAGQIDGTTAHAVERIIGIVAEEAGFVISETTALAEPGQAHSWHLYLPDHPREVEARVYPFYLPQFHSFAENDAWWGKQFSEWNNVSSGKPVFPGHQQPKLPSDLGYYDLNDPRVRPEQYALAQESGIEGFMYYYYWFAGKRLMDMPVEALRASDDEHPFCLMWANENWTRRWDGGEANVLIAQDYDEVPAERFIDDVREFITDSRYMTVEGKPLLAIYRITQIPDYQRVITHWRKRAEEFGLPGLHLITVDVGSSMQGIDGDVLSNGLDGTLEFPPHNRSWVPANRSELGLRHDFVGNILRYSELVREAENDYITGVPDERYPGVLVNFDNTARRQHQPDFWLGSNPYTFRRWMRGAVNSVAHRSEQERVVFVNAWNEWAEGAILEPSQRFGSTYLQAVRSAVVRA